MGESGGNKVLDDIKMIEEEMQQILSPETRKELKALKESLLSKLKSESKDKTLSVKAVEEPSVMDLRLHMLNVGLPFIGFGIMDNAILIWAGDQIDVSLGVMFGISTMCAAAIGNIVSDIAGVAFGTVIEDFCAKLRLPVAKLTDAQRQLRSVRFAGQFGIAVGLTIGCIIGMFPLLFMDSEKAERLKQEAHKEKLLKDMVDEAKSIIGAERAYLYLVVDSPTSTHTPHSSTKKDASKKYLYISGAKHLPLTGKTGILRDTVLTRKIHNISDVKEQPLYCYDNDFLVKNVDQKNIKNMVCVPVLNVDGDAIAVIQVVNKSEEISNEGTFGLRKSDFTKSDVNILKTLATQISLSFQELDDETKISLRDTLQTIELHGEKGIIG